jgi:hypothetical protein
VHVYVEDVVPLFQRYLGGRPVVTDPSVVDQDVYRPETLRHRLEHPVHLSRVGDVEIHGDGVTARGLDLLCHRLGAFAGTGGQGHVSADLGERLRESFS